MLFIGLIAIMSEHMLFVTCHVVVKDNNLSICVLSASCGDLCSGLPVCRRPCVIVLEQ